SWQHSTEVFQGPAEAVLERHLRLPCEQLAGARDVWAALLGIVDRQRPELNRARGTRQPNDDLCQLQHRHLFGIAEIYRLVVPLLDRGENAADQVGHVAEAARLRAVAVNRERLAPDGLRHEVGHRPAVENLHAWP